MTFFLPSNPTLFRQPFDEACKRILEAETEVSFYHLFVQFIHLLRGHPLLKEYFGKLENEVAKKKKEFNSAALEALEDNWKGLLRYHHHDFKQRKQLVQIKRIITAPNEISSQPIYLRILSRMWEFRYYSPFCNTIRETENLFRTAKSKRHLRTNVYNYLYPPKTKYFSKRKISPLTLEKKNKYESILKKSIESNHQENPAPLRYSVDCVMTILFSPKIKELDQKFSMPGRNDFEKRQNMQIHAKTDPAYCWERVLFLYQCYTFENKKCSLKWTKGRWEDIREIVWQSALERGDNEVLFHAQMALKQKLSAESSSHIDSFLMCEHQFHRSEFEKYLRSLQHHIHTQLFKIENETGKAVENYSLVLLGTQKASFVIDLASKFWKKYPTAKRDEAFEDYLMNCPSGKILSRPRWDQIVRERKLDPRPAGSKKRGPGKKTLQN